MIRVLLVCLALLLPGAPLGALPVGALEPDPSGIGELEGRFQSTGHPLKLATAVELLWPRALGMSIDGRRVALFLHLREAMQLKPPRPTLVAALRKKLLNWLETNCDYGVAEDTLRRLDISDKDFEAFRRLFRRHLQLRTLRANLLRLSKALAKSPRKDQPPAQARRSRIQAQLAAVEAQILKLRPIDLVPWIPPCRYRG